MRWFGEKAFSQSQADLSVYSDAGLSVRRRGDMVWLSSGRPGTPYRAQPSLVDGFCQ
jgi:hypothetical protein